MKRSFESIGLSNMNKLAASAAIGMLALGGCTIDSYLNDSNNVQCDGLRTKEHFSDGLRRVSFLIHQENDVVSKINVYREGDFYDIDTVPLKNVNSDEITLLSDSDNSGKSNPDFTISIGKAIWSVDVRMYEPAVVIQGNCTE